MYTNSKGESFPDNEIRAHFPNVSLPLVINADTLIYLGLTHTTDAPTASELREAAKIRRELSVSQIKVTTAAGNTFDGDEVSQGRMARAIIGLSTGLSPSVNWVLADNSVIQASVTELTEALVLSGLAQAAIWVIP